LVPVWFEQICVAARAVPGTAAATAAAISTAKTTPSNSLAYPLLRALGTGGGAFMRILLRRVAA
jgi:hypothetical protein